ncbi:MAG: flagellar export chaperone FliS [Gemmatimonadales bacterium]
MSQPYAALAYRESEILTASPSRLVVITYDALLAAMTRARVGIAMQNHDVAFPALQKSRELVGELLASLDRDRGGDIAVRLSALYVFVLGDLLSVGLYADVKRLDRNIAIVRELREAFAQIATTAKTELS